MYARFGARHTQQSTDRIPELTPRIHFPTHMPHHRVANKQDFMALSDPAGLKALVEMGYVFMSV